MEEIVSFIDKIKKYYWPTFQELKSLIIASLVFGFIISFRDWGTESFNPAVGFTNLIISIIIVMISFIFHLTGQRFWALATGYRQEFKIWGMGLAISLILAFLTNGKLWFIIPFGFIIHHLGGHRLGWFRYDINYWALALTSLAGPMATVLFCVIIKIFGIIVPGFIFSKLLVFNVLYAVYSMSPIPPADGSKIFYGGRMLYAFSLPFVIASSLMLYSSIPIWISIGGSFLIGVVLWLLYYLFFEKDIWSL